MGVWGMGLTQSDEFCEVYESFMRRYNKGWEAADITAAILSQYHEEFDDADGVWHDVYFALAKAEWMCCAQSEQILSKVKNIIEMEANVAFYRELGATESDLEKRRRNLEKFWTTLQTPRAKPKRREKEPQIKELPPVRAGDCYAYQFGPGYRILVILDRFKERWSTESVFCCILKRTFDAISSDIDVLNEEIGHMATYTAYSFIAQSKLRKIGSVSLPANFRYSFPRGPVDRFGKKTDFTQEQFKLKISTIALFLRKAD